MAFIRASILFAMPLCICAGLFGCSTHGSLREELEASPLANFHIQDGSVRAKIAEMDVQETLDWSAWEDTSDEGSASSSMTKCDPSVEYIVIVQQVNPNEGHLSIAFRDENGQLISVEPRRATFFCAGFVVHESVYEPPRAALVYETSHKGVEAVRFGVYSRLVQ